jgi:hypothetical protein
MIPGHCYRIITEGTLGKYLNVYLEFEGYNKYRAVYKERY